MRNKLLVTYFVMALFLCLSICAFSGCENQKDRYDTEGFVMVREVVPNVIEEIRYYGDYNFVGEPIDGYNAPVALLTREAAEALRIAADRFEAEGYVIKIYDAYRPQRATEAFLHWAEDENDERMQAEFYPELTKEELVEEGHIVKRTRHSRGSTVDLTLVEIDTGKEIDTGGPFDYFDEISTLDTKNITEKQRENREKIRIIMEEAGFMSYEEEWWHFILKDEPYPDTYFDFPVDYLR